MERCLYGLVAGGGFGESCLYVAAQSVLIAEREVEREVQGVGEVALAARLLAGGGILVLVVSLLSFSLIPFAFSLLTSALEE